MIVLLVVPSFALSMLVATIGGVGLSWLAQRWQAGSAGALVRHPLSRPSSGRRLGYAPIPAITALLFRCRVHAATK